jgi:hypothetical protein
MSTASTAGGDSHPCFIESFQKLKYVVLMACKTQANMAWKPLVWLVCASYAPPAFDTTNLPPEQAPARSVGFRQHVFAS